MKLKIAHVIGLNTDQKAAQVIRREEDEENIFLAVMFLSCDDAFTKGRQTLSEASDFYFDFEGSASEKLKATFDETSEKLSKEGSFDLLLAAISGKVLYLIGQGEVEVYLKRGGQLSPLLTVGAPSQLISGFLQEKDKLLLSTKSLIDFLGSELGQVLDLPKDSWEEEMSAKVGGANLENQGLAALALEVEPVSEEKPIPTLSSEQEMAEVETEAQPNVLGIFSKLLVSASTLRRFFPKSGRGRLILAIILILIIGVGTGLKYKSSQDQQRQAQFNQLLQQAKDDFNAAKGLASLNPKEAKDKLDSATSRVNQALALKPNQSEAQDLKKQIEISSSSILQQFTASEFPLFLDLDLIKKDFKALQMSLSAGKLLLLDPDVKTLISLDIAKKSNQILAGEEQLGEAVFASINGNFAFVYSRNKGVLRVDITNQKVSEVSKSDDDWGNILDASGFASNVYLLDVSKNQIWKYLPTSGGYSAKREYLLKDVKADFGNAVRMQIESSVYLIKQDGEMLRFTRGSKDNFSYEGLDKGVKDPKSFFVSSDTDNLYLLDSGNSRLLILTKTGSYKGQIEGEKFATATDLVVDEKGKKVYLLEGSKIYQVDLK
ncbi:hypothetical protein HYT18_01220 [Candidatus Microgenomates bacterium]|nr:hypothetical protein [Candidatus Microgenomates bacterium]